MKNYFSASSHLETKDFIGLLIWMAAFIPGASPPDVNTPIFEILFSIYI